MPKYDMESFDPKAVRADSIDTLSAQMVGWRKRVLEVGCATGYMAEFLQTKRGCTVVGVEYDAESASRSEARGVRTIVGDAESTVTISAIMADVEHGGQFEVVLASAVLEHLRYPEALLERVHRFLTPNGYLVVTLPNIAHWIMRRNLILGRFRYEQYGLLDETHLRFYTVETARELLATSGFQVVRCAFDPGEGIPLLSAAARHMKWLKRGEARVTALRPGLLAYQTAFLARPCRTTSGAEVSGV